MQCEEGDGEMSRRSGEDGEREPQEEVWSRWRRRSGTVRAWSR
jgi:hypothetical protein